MKKILLVILISPLIIMAQEKDLSYSQTQDIKFVSSIKNATEINSYTTKNGLEIKIGDTLTIGNANINREKYMLDDTFATIAVGKVKSTNKKQMKFLPHRYSGTKVIVHSLFVTHEKYKGYNPLANRKEMPLYVSVFVKNPKNDFNSLQGVSKAFSISRKTILDIEKSLYLGEIMSSNHIRISREEAIKKLKESKDLMDLDLLSKEEYEKIRKDLTPIIMNK